MTFFIFFAFVFGTLLGSFLNVVILRHNTGRGITGRSGCFSCGKTLSWYELVPVISFLVAQGRCFGCKAKISVQYPLVELASGALVLGLALPYASVFMGSGFASVVVFIPLVLSVYITLTYLAILVYDARHFIIPDSFVWGSALAAFLFQASMHYELLSIGGLSLGEVFTQMLFVVAGAFLIAFPFALLWVISKGEWVGLGDAKLLLSLGLFLGPQDGINMFLCAVWAGAFIGLALLGYDALRARVTGIPRLLSRKTALPFGPFLIVSAYVVFFFGVSPLAWFGLENLFG